ncbi:peptidase, M48 family [Ketogulonicigenium robustum]|uniref:Peptidase, M48 family n=1 Tax=Ketogulonicigenium robustum TaxID=92947 RepID=A0A1W6NWL0_9RHOB|nr:M48 family metallopeptidase [Ketogulonicigenium robustum]ARO13615.1 peptidase, M48 family [Ketogulonicigenium robustum]
MKAIRVRCGLLTVLFATLLLAACGAPQTTSAPSTSPKPSTSASAGAGQPDLALRAQGFVYAASNIEPVAEAVCRDYAAKQNVPRNCNFRIVIDDQSDIGANAYQTLDANGNPIIALTVDLLLMVANSDEIAFILAHEASHHILGHLQQRDLDAARASAVAQRIAGSLPIAPEGALRNAAEIGAAYGALRYSKDYELQADSLGTVIAAEAGFDPLRGAAFFFRIPDPGNQILGSHPANAERLSVIRTTYRDYVAQKAGS